MESLTAARVEQYLTNRLHFKYHETGSIMERMQTLARVGGFDMDGRFASAGLGAGPEARVAAGIVALALGGAGGAVSEMAMKSAAARWVRTLRPKGRK